MPAIFPRRMVGRMRFLLRLATTSWPPAFPSNLGTACGSRVRTQAEIQSLIPNACSLRVTDVGFEVPRFLALTPSLSHPLVRFRLDGFPANYDKAEEAEKGLRSGPGEGTRDGA